MGKSLKELSAESNYKWGMVIDQDLCTGCQACVAACAMENNISFVGEADAGYGRTLHWMHIERFWEGEYPEVKLTSFQPVLASIATGSMRTGVPGLCLCAQPVTKDQLAGIQSLCGNPLLCNNCPYQVGF
jgi:molybdopterin-containing oxidoreductase family iron-sulfur binding subunit